MRKLVLTCLATGILTTSLHAQTLFTFGGNEVSKQEFLRIYEKNTLNKKPDFSDPALREYLNLYSLFRMKVKEAEVQHLDTLQNIQKELDTYRKQLAKNYLTDDQVTSKLITEAYDRMKEDVHVSHILIMAAPTMAPADTLRAYQRIDSIYKALTAPKSKVNFADLAKQFSDDKGSKDNGGDIGFITSLQTVYPFENAAYNTQVGKVSAPFRTQFGYHIIKVTDRKPSHGEIKVAQILITTSKSKGPDAVTIARAKMDTVLAEMKKGVSFDTLVKRYSEDKFTINYNGVMKPFTVGRTTPLFEAAAFGLKKPGDISQPVQTEYGFHIIKLLDKYPLKPYDSLKDAIKRKVESDSRAQNARISFIEKVKQKNGYEDFPASYSQLLVRINMLPDTGKMANTFRASDFTNMTAPLFKLKGKSYTQSEFMNFAENLTRGRINGPRPIALQDMYKMYMERTITDFEEHRLVEENPDFKNLMDEYRSGILLFELMDRNVWGKASKDSVGLKEFYLGQKDKYKWEPGYIGSVYRFKDEKSMNEGLKLLAKKNMTDSALLKEMNVTVADAVTIQHGHFEFKNNPDVPSGSVVKGKPTAGVKGKDGAYTVVKAEQVFPTATNKTLEEARGYIVAEYQDYLEKHWNESLRNKYPFVLKEDVYKSIKN
ncbi:MAG: peptidylprolyl isomerase [Bacteroidota bacterium]